jgi:drug/metabolite transporter (DMT)-like permease
MGIFFAVVNASLLGFANFLLKKSFKDFPPSVAFFIFGTFALIIWGIVGLYLGVNFHNIYFGATVGLVSAILGQGIYVYVLEKGELSITATILASFSIYTIIFSMIFNKERPSDVTLLFIILTIIGTIVVSFPKKINKAELKKVHLIAWAIFAAICIGAADTLSKFYITQTSVGSFLFFVSIAQFFVSIVYLWIDKQPITQFFTIAQKLQEYKYALWGSLCITVSTLCLFLSFNFTLASIASPISSSYPIITIVLAILFLKEKLSVKDSLGILFVLISVIMIGVNNP